MNHHMIDETIKADTPGIVLNVDTSDEGHVPFFIVNASTAAGAVLAMLNGAQPLGTDSNMVMFTVTPTAAKRFAARATKGATAALRHGLSTVDAKFSPWILVKAVVGEKKLRERAERARLCSHEFCDLIRDGSGRLSVLGLLTLDADVSYWEKPVVRVLRTDPKTRAASAA